MKGYLYFQNYRYAGYAILRDTHISVTPVRKVVHQHIQCRLPPFCQSHDTYVVLMASKQSKSVNKENLEPKMKSSRPGKH